MRNCIRFLPLMIILCAVPVGWGAEIECEGTYPYHLQGICVDEHSIFWSFTDILVKTDKQGRLLKTVKVPKHSGDLCYQEKKVYVAVNLGDFNSSQGDANSWVYIYNADDLSEITRHRIPEVVYGAGGIGCHGSRFVVVGGLPDDLVENYIYEYDDQFRFVQRYAIPSGYTKLGIQTITYSGGSWWLGTYGPAPALLLKTDESFKLTGIYNFQCSEGIVGLADGSFLVGRGFSKAQKKDAWGPWSARIIVADPDEKNGLTIRK